MKRTALFFTETQLRRLKAISKRTGLKVSELIRRFVDEGIARTK